MPYILFVLGSSPFVVLLLFGQEEFQLVSGLVLLQHLLLYGFKIEQSGRVTVPLLLQVCLQLSMLLLAGELVEFKHFVLVLQLLVVFKKLLVLVL